MSRSEHFNEGAAEQRFFHGTTADLKEGDELLPASKVGKGRGRSVWLTTHPTAAENWAHARAGREGSTETAEDGWATRTTVPVHVYEVEPHGLQQDRNGHHKAERAVITKRLK